MLSQQKNDPRGLGEVTLSHHAAARTQHQCGPLLHPWVHSQRFGFATSTVSTVFALALPVALAHSLALAPPVSSALPMRFSQPLSSFVVLLAKCTSNLSCGLTLTAIAFDASMSRIGQTFVFNGYLAQGRNFVFGHAANRFNLRVVNATVATG